MNSFYAPAVMPFMNFMNHLGKACDAFYEFASTRINSEDDLVKVMNLIQNMKIELPYNETSPRIVEEDCSSQNQATILDPKLARSKGRPPSKRKTSIVDQIVKKKLCTKEKANVHLEVKKLNTFSVLNLVIESAHKRAFNENGSVNTLAPFNPNQEHFGQAPYYSQVTNYNATCSDLLQEQHHMNDQYNNHRDAS
ncbi:hypothetical protein MTR_2g090105 [Medicago truncatula]|uniref:Uncharacterized protein n=1 Tax=Medicago truncatula TaxID=3880 RepID=A0A072VC97_MEDTR|nr:hypothetical protein MTR_2g090105 [Medicago truncatula]